ncbi:MULTISPECIES: HNH endonuclease [Enterobacteriaceae]|uniref:HNH nuclease domain-containing protein n=2 Tax=Enterobacter cloacae complex TaxID=354276 RepID=A0AAX1WF16_9ENTR|nr:MULTISPECIES: HNH endonuclease [Enterobacteriaceae]HBW4241537.1 hypothetical protein [Klebsiella pneumoniae]HCH7904088.1 HNH endonuclease [Klebsiella oxytoca]MDF3830748.1 HNH endonuclease [Pseudocitrobacter sp. 2023EL-00150]MDH1000959.1 HNH endonuclease [Citrobacter freundii]MEC5375548.1 HNH endonuclease [Pseudocitrobacter sp. MW920760]
MKTISIPLEEVRRIFELDPKSPSGLRWMVAPNHRIKCGMPAGSKVGNGYYQVKIAGISYGAHRVVWSIANGEIPQGMTIDHIDRNPGNNEISNLRLADKYLQARNRKPYKRVGMAGKSKGNIHLRKSGRYDATVGINGTVYYSSGRDKSVLQAWIQEMLDKHQAQPNK